MYFVDKCLQLDDNIRKEFDIGLIWEGNYWDDQDVHDCCDVDWGTCDIITRKVGHTIRQHIHQNGAKVLIYLPRVMQLPMAILGAIQVGVIPIVIDPLDSNAEQLESVMVKYQPEIVIMVDAVWQGQELIEVKKNVENLPCFSTTQLLIIRHVSPNFGVPPPKKHLPARRPSYRTILDLRDGRDLEWSTVMSSVDEDVKVSKYDWKHDDIMIITVEKGECVELKCGEIMEKMETQRNEKFDRIENIMVMDVPTNVEKLVQFLMPWYFGKTMTLFEGPPNYPDSSRLAQLIGKHTINCILSTSPINLPNPEYLQFFPTNNLTLISSNLSNIFQGKQFI